MATTDRAPTPSSCSPPGTPRASTAPCATAVRDVGLSSKDLEGSHVTARVHFLKGAPAEFGLAVDLELTAPLIEPDKARELMARTHQICPYSKATAGNIDVRLTVAKHPHSAERA